MDDKFQIIFPLAVIVIIVISIAAFVIYVYIVEKKEDQEAKFSKAKSIILSTKGIDTVATICNYSNHYDDHLLEYEYTAIMPDSSEIRFKGAISTGWDIVHLACSGCELPAWKDRYTIGYQFPIRYLKSKPEIHYPLENFDFSE